MGDTGRIARKGGRIINIHQRIHHQGSLYDTAGSVVITAVCTPIVLCGVNRAELHAQIETAAEFEIDIGTERIALEVGVFDDTFLIHDAS